MLWRLKSLFVTVWVDAAMEEGAMEAVSGRDAVGEKPKIPSKGLRRLVNLRAKDGRS
jgi:hypothetical protein